MFVAFQQDIQRISILFDAQQHAKQPANTLIFHTTEPGLVHQYQSCKFCYPLVMSK